MISAPILLPQFESELTNKSLRDGRAQGGKSRIQTPFS